MTEVVDDQVEVEVDRSKQIAYMHFFLFEIIEKLIILSRNSKQVEYCLTT